MSTSSAASATPRKTSARVAQPGDALTADDSEFGSSSWLENRNAGTSLLNAVVSEAPRTVLTLPETGTLTSAGISFGNFVVGGAVGASGTATVAVTPAASSPTAPITKTVTTPNWISSLSDSVIKADITTAASDGVVTYTEILKTLTDVDSSINGKSAGLTASQFSDLKSIVTNASNGVSMSSYIQDVLGSLVNGDAANAYYTGGTKAVVLGNLHSGSNYTQLNQLIGKWFLGTDLPSATVTMSGSSLTVSYQACTAPVFSTGGPSINDINQGNMGDCYLLSSLADVARNNPSIITSMIRDNGNNTFGVRFYVGGQENWVTVSNYLPQYNGKMLGNDRYASTPNMWVDLVERAYAQMSASGVLTGNTSANYGNSFSSIANGGVIDNLLQEISNASTVTQLWANGNNSWSTQRYSTQGGGVPFTTTSGSSNQTVLSSIVTALNSKNDVSLCSLTNSYDSAGYQCLVSGHALSITGYNSTTGNLIIRNPWGTLSSGYNQNFRTTFEVSMAQLAAAGDYITFDNVSASAPTLAIQTANQTWQAGQAVSFALPAGTFTDPRGQAITYTASLANGQPLPSWLTFNSSTRTFSGTAPSAMQPLSIQVTATDATGLSSSESFQATLAGSSAPPVISNQTASQTWRQGTAVNFALATNTFTDPQGSALSYTATLADGTALPSWLNFNAATGTFSGTVAVGTGNLSVRVTARDSLGLSTSETFAITTVAAAAPVISNQTASQTWRQGSTVNFALATNTFTDPQGSALSYTATLGDGTALPSWLKFNAATGTFSGTVAVGTGNLSVRVTARDSVGLSASETFSITTPAAVAPIINTQTAGQTWGQGSTVNFALASNTFTDPQGSSLSYSASLSDGTALPSWLKFDAGTETFSGTVAIGTKNLAIRVTARDGLGLSTSETFSVTTPAQARPVLNVQTPNLSWGLGKSVSYTLPAGTFTGGSGVTYAAMQLQSPGDVDATSWLRFDGSSLKFAGTVAANERGTLHVAVLARDSAGNSATDFFDISFTNSSGIRVAAGTVPSGTTKTQSLTLLAPGR